MPAKSRLQNTERRLLAQRAQALGLVPEEEVMGYMAIMCEAVLMTIREYPEVRPHDLEIREKIAQRFHELAHRYEMNFAARWEF